MDLENFKDKASDLVEYGKFKKLHQAKVQELRSKEIRKIKDQFISFFDKNPEFKINESAKSITAKYK